MSNYLRKLQLYIFHIFCLFFFFWFLRVFTYYIFQTIVYFSTAYRRKGYEDSIFFGRTKKKKLRVTEKGKYFFLWKRNNRSADLYILSKLTEIRCISSLKRLQMFLLYFLNNTNKKNNFREYNKFKFSGEYNNHILAILRKYIHIYIPRSLR